MSALSATLVTMGELSKNLAIIEKLHKTGLSTLKHVSMLYDMALAIRDDDLDRAILEMKTVKMQSSVLTRTDGEDAVELYWNSMLFLAQNRQVDEGLIYLERYRLPEDRFYLPRRRVFRKLGITQALQRLVDDEIDILTLSFPPGT